MALARAVGAAAEEATETAHHAPGQPTSGPQTGTEASAQTGTETRPGMASDVRTQIGPGVATDGRVEPGLAVDAGSSVRAPAQGSERRVGGDGGGCEEADGDEVLGVDHF